MACALSASAAQPCNVPLAVIVENPDSSLSPSETNAIGMRLRRALMAEGFGAPDSTAAFALEASVRESLRDIIPGTRPTVAIIYETDIALVNRLTGETLSQHSLRLTGTGANESAARNSAVKSLNPNNRQLRRFMGHTDSDIANFYLSQLRTIETRALTLSRNGEYQKAMALLTTVPECIPDYSTVRETMETVWQQFRDEDCRTKYSLAKAAWFSTQNEQGAQLAAAYLAAIPEQSDCMENAELLMNEIRQWVANENERRQNLEQQLQMDYIEAMRQIGLEYARNQAANPEPESEPAIQPETEPESEPDTQPDSVPDSVPEDNGDGSPENSEL